MPDGVPQKPGGESWNEPAGTLPYAEVEIAEYRRRYGSLFDEIVVDVGALRSTGCINRARTLSAATGQRFVDDDYPAFFFGNLDASFVLVHLNPKLAFDRVPKLDGDPAVYSPEEHFQRHLYFGQRMYGPLSPRTHKSAFDHKQVRFLRQFDVIEFTDDAYLNLQHALDQKLQLELIPYGSPTFSTGGFTQEILSPHYQRIMRVIATVPRKYVIFCGSVFAKLLQPDWIVDEHTFHLTKNDGSLTRDVARFSNLRLPWGDRAVHAGLAHSWPRQGIPMASYGREVRARYAQYESAAHPA
jgi:hypothetical protein